MTSYTLVGVIFFIKDDYGKHAVYDTSNSQKLHELNIVSQFMVYHLITLVDELQTIVNDVLTKVFICKTILNGCKIY